MPPLELIVNPSAGGGRAGRALPGVLDELSRHGLEHRVSLTRSLSHARELARAAARRGAVAVAFGGDGIVGAVAGELAGRDALLGVLPGGRGNDLARVLGIPRNPLAACEVLAAGSVRRLDLGLAGEHSFIGVASCGLDSEVNRLANESRLPLGNLVYAYALLRALPRWSPARFTFRADGGRARELVGYSVAAANSTTFGGGMRIAPGASMHDGLLDVVLIGAAARTRYLMLAPTVFTGAHVRQHNVEVLRVRELELSADRPFTLYADGDPVIELPVTLRASPGAVQVLAPPQADR